MPPTITPVRNPYAMRTVYPSSSATRPPTTPPSKPRRQKPSG